MKYPNVNFPSNDKLWVEVCDFFTSNNINFSEVENPNHNKKSNDAKNLAPIEFSEYIPTVLPYHFSFTTPASSFDFVIVNLTQYKCIHTPFLKDVIKNFNLVFKNSLFYIYTNRNDIEPVKSYINKLLFRFPNLYVPKILSRNSKQIRNIALISANKLGNLGDDAVTWASYDSLRKVFPKSTIKIYHPPVFRWQVFRADLLVLGGGGLFYDGCFYNAMNYTRYIAWAKEADIPSCALGVGTQGIKTDLGKELYKNILDFCDFISVRDIKDAEILRQDVGTKTRLYVTQDMAFSLNRPARQDQLLSQGKKPIMLFSLIDTNAMRAAKKLRNYRKTASLILSTWQERFDIWCIVQSKGDIPLYLEHLPKKRLVHIPFKDIGQAVSIYKQADVVLTSRFHGLVFSILACVPVIATSSIQGKIYRLIHNSLPSMKQSYIPITDFTEGLATSRIYDSLQNPQKYTISSEARSQCIRASLLNEELLRYYFLDGYKSPIEDSKLLPKEYFIHTQR